MRRKTHKPSTSTAAAPVQEQWPDGAMSVEISGGGRRTIVWRDTASCLRYLRDHPLPDVPQADNF